jgi:alpha-tubulin suppressor-like RCC1 family protein
LFAVTVGDEHTCSFGLDSSFQGAVYCWGRQTEGQIGNGYVWPGSGSALGPAYTPFRVPLPAGYTPSAVEAGNEFACAIVSSSTVTNGVACWGRNFEGQLGRGTTTPSTTVSNATAAVIAGFTNVSQLAAGYNTACAIKSDGTVWCWGRRYTPTPTQVAGLANVAQLAVGSSHICARRGDNSIVCFGDNSGGQLGDGTTTARTGLVTPMGLTSVSTVAAGWAHTCARRATDGRILCWGGNSNGQIGDRMPGTNRLAPYVVPNLP